MEVPILYPWLIGEKENLRGEKFKENERKMKDFLHWIFVCVLNNPTQYYSSLIELFSKTFVNVSR